MLSSSWAVLPSLMDALPVVLVLPDPEPDGGAGGGSGTGGGSV